MKTKTILAVTATTAVLGAGLALAKMGKTDPKLPREVQPIHCMAGEWRGEATIAMGEQRLKAGVSMSCQVTAGGMGVLCQDRFTLPGGQVLEETDLFGWDAGDGKYHWYALTSDGDTHDHVAAPPADKNAPITFAYSGRKDGKPMQEIIKLSFSADGRRVEIANRTLSDGQVAFTMNGFVTRK